MLLNATNLAFAYDTVPVLRDVSLSLAAGEVVALLGPNGSGKSTLIQCLLGHLRPRGAVAWDDRPRAGWSPRDLARRVAYLPQSPAWEPTASVADVLRLGRAPYWRAFGLEGERDVAVVAEVARLLSLDELMARPLHALSGGQRQRVFLGRCLAQEPAAMLLDEPSTFLDLRHQVDLCELLRRLARERGIGVLLASHDLNLAAEFADRMVLLDGGRVAASGTPREVMEAGVLSRVYGVELEALARGGEVAPFVFPRVAR